MNLIARLFAFTSSILLCLAPLSSAFAKTIKLYAQPKVGAKVVGKVDSSAGIIPIFTPKDKNWLKVADPRNGNVGWIKTTDLNSDGKNPTSVIFTQQIMQDGKGPQHFQVIEYGNQPKKLTHQQIQALTQKMKDRQQSMQQSMQNMIEEMNKVYQHQWEIMREMNMPPIILPVVVMPEKPAPVTKAKQPATQTKATAKDTSSPTPQ